MQRQRPLVRRRFGVRATAPDAMARQLALLRAFRDRERLRVSIAALIAEAIVAVVAVSVANARSGPVATVAAFVGTIVGFAVVTFTLAALARPRDLTRALGLYRWVARADRRRWTETTADPAPSTPARARSWLEAHPSGGGSADLPRVELLVWIGELEAARRVAVSLPDTTPAERFDRAIEVALVSFVASGDGDLEPVRAALADVGDDPVRLARLALEEARRLAAARSDFLPPMLAARDALGPEVDGAVLADLARWVARPLLLLGVLSATVTFLAAGALPPR